MIMKYCLVIIYRSDWVAFSLGSPHDGYRKSFSLCRSRFGVKVPLVKIGIKPGILLDCHAMGALLTYQKQDSFMLYCSRLLPVGFSENEGYYQSLGFLKSMFILPSAREVIGRGYFCISLSPPSPA